MVVFGVEDDHGIVTGTAHVLRHVAQRSTPAHSNLLSKFVSYTRNNFHSSSTF